MNHEALCRAFCADVVISEVPMGVAVRTPFTRPDGDYLGFYVRKDRPTGQFRIEDDGATIAFLETQGVDLDVESRAEIFHGLLSEYGAEYDEEAVLIHTPYMREGQIGPRALAYSEMMVRMFDLLFLTSKRVARTFKEDLGKLIEETFRGGHVIEQDAFFSEEMRDYVADYIVRSPTGGALAVFAGTTEPKALEALLFWREQKERRIAGLKSMLVFERPKAPLKERTLSRVHNSGLLLGSFEGERQALADKMVTILHEAQNA